MNLPIKARVNFRRQTKNSFSSDFLIAPIVALLVCVSSLAAAETLTDTPERTYVTNGLVSAIVRVGQTIYIGGIFNRVGPPTGPGVELALDGSQNPGLPEITGAEGTVQCVASDGAGGWFVGGQFSRVGGVVRNHIAHILADHTVDPSFDPNADNYVTRIVVSGSTVYVAGPFTAIGGQPRSFIAGLSITDGTATAFDPEANVDVNSIAVSDSGSTVYVGGQFSTIGGQTRQGIAELNAADGSATNFNPNPNGVLFSVAISGSTLYVGGFFTTIGGQPRSNIAGIRLGGALDGTATSFNPGADQGVFAIAVSGVDSTVYASGLFATIGGQSRHYLAGLDPTTGNATSFDPDPDSDPISLVASASGTLYAGGIFTMIGGQPRNNVAELNADGSATPFNPNPNDLISAIGASASAVYVGGLMTSIGGVTRHSIAALNAADGTVTDFAPEASAGEGSYPAVSALAAKDNTIYVGGTFSLMGGQPRNNIAALDLSGAAVASWNPGANGSVDALALSNAIVYAGGGFTTIGGQSRQYIAALDAGDGTPTSFNPASDNVVLAILVHDPLVYVGGHFGAIGGQTRWSIAALDPFDGSATNWNAHINHDAADGGSNVQSVAVSGSTVYLGGSFVFAGGAPRANLAALQASDATATDFSADTDGVVFAVAASSSAVYAGGVFTEIGGQPRNDVAELDSTTGAVSSFDAGAAPQLYVAALSLTPAGSLYLGGIFHTFELGPQAGFASFNVGTTGDAIFENGFD
jgi:hypothetical protein